MSAMAIIDEIHEKGGKINSFKSHCGGLVAPESDDNPWHYKISWNPRNIILAGKAGAIYLENGVTVSKDYATIFELAPVVDLPGIGHLAYYPNRNSLSYIDTYHLHGVKNFVRTTLRYPAFCTGWNAIVQLHLTDETVIELAPNTTVQHWFTSHIQLNCYKLDPTEIENNPEMRGDYNVARAIATFNKRIGPLLVVFKEEVREQLIVDKPEDRGFFTKEQSELINGVPFNDGDQDKLEEVLTLSDGEVKYWDKRGMSPDYIYDLASEGWEEYIN
jgi:hypothetical protein